MSNYNYGLEPGIQGNGSSKLRFVLIFIVISALTAALVWWFWPDRTQKNGEEEKVSAAGQGNSIEPASQKKTAPENPSREPGVAAETAGIPSSAEVKQESSRKTAADAPKALPAAVDPTDPPLPDKGVVTEADKKGADLPVVPVDKVITETQEKALKEASLLLASRKFSEAEKLAEKALEGVGENSAFYRKAWRVLTEARVGLVFHGSSNPYVIRYRIRSGDSLSGVAGRFFTTVEMLRKKNKISGSRIFVGRQLYVVPGDWKIVVSKKYRLLKLYQKKQSGEKLFAVWEVGIGRMGKTPVAEFAIAARVRHPDWYLPDGRVFKYGEPGNQLGDYFLKLAAVSAPGRPLLGYGIHGASDESTVGRSLSNGCIRMRNADVETLYYLIPAGCRVNIVEK